MRKSAKVRLGLMVTLFAVLASLTVGFAQAATESWTLTNWDVHNIWHGQTVSYENFVGNVQFGGVTRVNASLTGKKYSFSFIDGSNTGWLVEIWQLAGDTYLSKNNTVTLSYLDAGNETLLSTWEKVNASSVKIACDGSSLVEFYINGAKKYQDELGGNFTLTSVQYWTNDVPVEGSMSYPSNFNGAFYLSLAGYSATSSAPSGDISSMTVVMVGLFTAILPLTIYMAVFKLVPKLVKGMRI